ncbi:hypothetical protein PT974_05769 [Cladobotryum mycophilum]|uniref:Uncharacterized protein n=1 Tax=Cladobotryum mycophilum TaxID=491253 RepID=A0ABR0SJN6_9HYPO
MAFQQSTRQTMQRVARSALGEQDVSGLPTRSPQEEQQPELSQTWVLFSPPTEVTTTSYLTETERSIETPGRSRLSDLGSLNTEARTAPASAVVLTEENQSAALSAVEESVADDAELDSLDGHLPGFRSLPRSNQHVFPSHDGLGSFRLDQPALGPDAQDHIYQFERFNPRRIRRRLNSFEQAQFELEEAQVQEAEKRERIEAWRLEHSRILLDEIQRETRRRQKSKASSQRAPQPEPVEAEVTPENMDWHDQEHAVEDGEAGESEGFLARITRKVLRELLGIDDRLLSVLFGEQLPSDEDLARTPRISQLGEEARLDDSWQLHVLEKVSKELGLLVNQLSKHPGAFSTYTRVQQMPLPYAGLPIIPESADGRVTTRSTSAEQLGESSFPEFKPTVLPSTHGVPIPSRKSNDSDATVHDSRMSNTFTQEEWEQDMDIKLVFRYLVSRFTLRPESSVSTEAPRHNIPKPQDAAAKAARVRQHHPLISRSRPTERRVFKSTGPSSPVALRHHSSCASQSTRRSARRSSVSSRHYWDIGGSIKTGSVIAPNGPMGSWGEV